MRTRKPKGLGDTIENVLHATGIDKLAKFVFGEDCGCEERKETLNKLFPYVNPLCLNELEYNILTDLLPLMTPGTEFYTDKIKPTQQMALLKISNRIFNRRDNTTSCSSCLQKLILDLNKVYNEYDTYNAD